MQPDMERVERIIDFQKVDLASIYDGVIEGTLEGVKEGVVNGSKKGVKDGIKDCILKGFENIEVEGIEEREKRIMDPLLYRIPPPSSSFGIPLARS